MYTQNGTTASSGEAVPGSGVRSALPGKYLTFHLAGEYYGFSILAVQEIIGLQSITTMPKVPAWIRGVINLRGRVIPILDLRRRFGMEMAADTERTCIIIAKTVRGGNDRDTGILVDSVSDVVDLAEAQLDAIPSVGVDPKTSCLTGIGKIPGRVILLLSVENVVGIVNRAYQPSP